MSYFVKVGYIDGGGELLITGMKKFVMREWGGSDKIDDTEIEIMGYQYLRVLTGIKHERKVSCGSRIS